MVKVVRWGEGLAVLLTPAMVEALQLREGDEVEVRLAGGCVSPTARCIREDALARLEALGWDIPPEFSFSRDGANERGV